MTTMTTGRRLPPLPTVKDILRMYRINATKKLSQNFIMDPRLLDRFARLGQPQGKLIVEVGPGPGGITRSILGQGARRCVAIEKDARFLPALHILNEASGGRLEVVHGDVMTFNMEKLFPDSNKVDWEGPHPDIEIMGNLPFNVSTPLTIRWLRAMSERSSLWRYGRVPLTLTYQLEVAQRMAAPPGNTIRSRLSVVCQNWARVNLKFTIPGAAFMPKPDVDVAVVTMHPLTVPYIEHPFPLVNKVVSVVFQGKRKNIKNTIKKLFPETMAEHLSNVILDETGLKPTQRAIDLDMSDWSRLCNSYVRILKENPSLAKYQARRGDPDLGDMFDDVDGDSDKVVDSDLVTPDTIQRTIQSGG